MNKVCYNCKHYGLCNVESKTCDTFKEATVVDVVIDIEAFNRKWMSKHNKGITKYLRYWFPFDPELLQKRIEARDKFLNGETEEEFVKKIGIAMEEAYSGNTGEERSVVSEAPEGV